MNDTWEWDGSMWSMVATPNAPPPRYATGMAYDSRNQFIVMVAGDNGFTPGGFNDTWTYQSTDAGATWTQSTVAGPGGRRSFAIAYDRGRQATVLFGGWSGGSSYLTDTWEWDGGSPSWTQRATVGPTGSFLPAMAYDDAMGEILLYGGATSAYTTCATATAETWAWNSSSGTWTQLQPAHSPPARADHSMAYDAQRQRVVLSGGCDGAGTSNETWEWDGADWTLSAVAGPPPRAAFGMAYDTARSASVIFSGCGVPPESCPAGSYLSDTWEYRP